MLAAWPWHWSASAWSALTFLVLTAAALFAWFQVREAQRLRKEQARPFVLIDFDAWSTIVEIQIMNIGKTIARDVRFDFDPPLVSTHDHTADDTRPPVGELSLFRGGIPSLAPRKEIKVFFDQFPARVEAKLPLTYRVQVSYRDHAGEEYSEPMVLDLAAYVGTGGVTRYGLHDIYNQVKTIADNVKRWTDSSGLKVMTRADMKERSAEWEARLEERKQAAGAAQAGSESVDDENSNGAS
jgi:hypothetical protein